MRSFYMVLLAGIMSVSLVACTQQQADTTAEKSENVGETMAEKSENAVENTGEAVENTGEAMGNSADSAGNAVGEATESVTNAGVTAKIKNAITLSNTIDNTKSQINVNTTDTQVILKGHVTTQKEKDEAAALAKANAGNRTVDNQLTVGGQ